MTTKTTRLMMLSLAIPAMLGIASLGMPAQAQTKESPAPSSGMQQPPMRGGAMPMGGPMGGPMMGQGMHKGMMMSPERVEERIKDLHEKLKITEAQKADWDKVAETMRGNANTIHQLIQERQDKGAMRTALEDLESYHKIAATHAEGLEKFIPVFKTLYDSMSDEQKKNADMVFAHYEGRGRHKMMGKDMMGKPGAPAPAPKTSKDKTK